MYDNRAANGRLPTAIVELPTCFFSPIPGNRIPTLEDVLDLYRSIKAEGQLVAGLCYRDPEREGYWIIAAGNRRWKACDALGILFKFVSIEGNTSPAQMVKIALTDNIFRKNMSFLEVAELIERYAELTGIKNQCEIAAALQLEESEVSRARKLPKRLIASLHDSVRQLQIGRSCAELIASLPPELQQIAADHYLSFKPDKPKRDCFGIYINDLKRKHGCVCPLREPPAHIIKDEGCELRFRDGKRDKLRTFLESILARLKKKKPGEPLDDLGDFFKPA